MTHSDRLAQYYDYTEPFYRLFWHGKTGALHYGLADETTRSLQDELINTNKFLAAQAGISPGEAVLDAGCGVGGSAIWLAKNYDVSVTGITLSHRQVARARISAKNISSVNFEVRDFLDTGLPDKSFDIVWAIESVCHAKSKALFIREAYRLLRKGGRMIIADGILLRKPENPIERKQLDLFLQGLVLPGLASEMEFRNAMTATGFRHVKFWGKTENILPSARRLFRMCRVGHPLARITEALGLTPPLLTANNLAGIVQYRIVSAGLAGYGVFYGEK